MFYYNSFPLLGPNSVPSECCIISILTLEGIQKTLLHRILLIWVTTRKKSEKGNEWREVETLCL